MMYGKRNGQYSRGWTPITDDYEGATYGYSPPPIDIYTFLTPLINQIKKYDALRLRLEYKGGVYDDLSKLAEVLNTSVTIKGRFRRHKIQLTQQDTVRTALTDIDYNIHLDIRLLDTKMPVYYLCRVHHDCWGEYSLVVEDLYMSPGYHLPDEHFVRLMSAGHETYFLRLSQFRRGIENTENIEDETKEQMIDSVLYDLGRHVFQAAWHEDQQLAIMVANCLGLPCFRQAIELLYLCLSGELCELRSAVNESMVQFFEEVYTQPSIARFLKMLTRLDGGKLNQLPQQAAQLYSQLLKSFSKFLSLEVTWGTCKSRIKLWKLLYGNFSRMKLVGKPMRKDKQFIKAITDLESAAQNIINEILTKPKEKNVWADAANKIQQNQPTRRNN